MIPLPLWRPCTLPPEIDLFKGHGRKGKRGSLVVYADKIRRTEEGDNGEELEREIPFFKSYTVLNVEQIEACRQRITKSQA